MQSLVLVLTSYAEGQRRGGEEAGGLERGGRVPERTERGRRTDRGREGEREGGGGRGLEHLTQKPVCTRNVILPLSTNLLGPLST